MMMMLLLLLIMIMMLMLIMESNEMVIRMYGITARYPWNKTSWPGLTLT